MIYKYLIKRICILGLVLFAFSCSPEKHFLTDEGYREEVHKQFEERRKLVEVRDSVLFTVLDKKDVSLEEREALEFLYSYMPLSDLADYDGEFYLNQVRYALKTKNYFGWGKDIPEELFRHFVLVHRVNTENLDNAREVFFEELKDRVKGLSMEDAALEVNHWCHEKITYRATDRRTSAPLDLLKTSWGRCGEQSTFTVMALRSVGIPARQCYTPLWVHSDSNHAWVEAWIDGKWYYLGASEPEAELNVAWFTASAMRAMMVRTNVFGKYNGVEDKILDEPLYSTINILGTYADTRNISVKVVDEESNPIENASVSFQVYNYAQFGTIANLKTDASGIATLKVNAEGDLFISAQKGDMFGYKKTDQKDSENILILSKEFPIGREDQFVMNIPPEKKIAELSPDKIAQNAIRLAQEDSIRNKYMSTFIQEEAAYKLAKEWNLDEKKVWRLLSTSQGNWEDISEFMGEYRDNALLIGYLESLSDKDLHDTPKAYLTHHIENGDKVGIKEGTPSEMYARYIYSPRIDYELIRPWRTFLQEQFSPEVIKEYQENPSLLQAYVNDSITITDSENYYNCPVSPRGVFELKLADSRSRDIFFVALCRSLGIASRLEPSTARPQYYEGGQWVDVLFEARTPKQPKGQVTFVGDKDNIVKPAYSTHYTISKLEGTTYKQRSFRGDSRLKDLPGTVDVDAGYYMLTIGIRANNGSVGVVNRYFEVLENQDVTQKITLPKSEGLIQVQGSIDPNTVVELDSGSKSTLKEQMFGKGLILVFADPDKEPTKHILQDLPAVREYLDAWGGGVLFVVPDDKVSKAFSLSSFKGLPAKSAWATDNGRKILNAASGTLQLDFVNNFPLVLYLNTNGGILYSHQGYTIGIGENIVKTIKQEAEQK